MTTVRRLPDDLVNKIAAGEVVERPASVVKELIENALDAGASRIVIETMKGGKDRIRVSDDGCGMEKEDLFMALERHATSKIASAEDLARIHTLGFRGEAIPSIAAVSRFTCSSAPRHGEGYSVQVHGGILRSSAPISLPRGTEVVVEDLFFNLPARRKFLKSDEREGAAVKELVQRFAMVNPQVGFSFTAEGKSAFSLSPARETLERAAAIWKAPRAEIVANTVRREGVEGSLLLASPYRTFTGPSVITVNGRIVSDRRINAVILRVLRETLGGENRANHLLMLTLPDDALDVNVHPAKSEVRFRTEAVVLACVEELFLTALTVLRHEANSREPFPAAPERDETPRYPAPAAAAGRVADRQASYPLFPSAKSDEPSPPADGFDASVTLTGHRMIGTLFGAYVAVERGETLYLVDQHAAHERIVYTRLRQAMERKSGLTQMAIVPLTVRLSSAEMAVFRERGSIFSSLGFVLDELDEETLVIRGVPALPLETDWPALVKGMIADILEQGFSTAWDEKFLSLVATRACKSAVRAERPLEPGEIARLIADIDASEMLTCPHGRPFFVVIRKEELDRKVGR